MIKKFNKMPKTARTIAIFMLWVFVILISVAYPLSALFIMVTILVTGALFLASIRIVEVLEEIEK